MTKQEALLTIKNSAFNRSPYLANFSFKRIVRSLMTYINEDVEEITENVLKYGVPEFQRANTAWTTEMKISFVENLYKGMSTTIKFYVLNSDYKTHSYSRCKIIDGLQRTTAILDFIDGKFTIFGELAFEDLTSVSNGLHHIVFEIFRFDTTDEAIEFYIEMNENITHSKSDIDKARSFLNSSK